MRDRKLMKITKTEHRQVTEAEVQQAFHTLDEIQKARFLQSHEGQRKYKSHIMRVYLANTFRKGLDNYVLLMISLLIHSCTPNAEKDDPATGEEVDAVVAVKRIAKGEEVHISYYGDPFPMKRKNSKKMLHAYYGFWCGCLACTSDTALGALSDARRLLIDALIWSLKGFGPGNHLLIDLLTGDNAELLTAYIGSPRPKCAPPLTLQQQTAYLFLMAKLCEAEGRAGVVVAGSYAAAATLLRHRVEKMKDVVVLDSARFLGCWIKEAIRLSIETRGDVAQSTQDMWKMWKELAPTPIGRAIDMVGRHEDVCCPIC